MRQEHAGLCHDALDAGAVVLDGEDVLALPCKEFDIKVR